MKSVLPDHLMLTVLPFGLSLAPNIFSKKLKPFGEKLPREGKPIVLFFDDGLGASHSVSLINICSSKYHANLLKFGSLPIEE